MDNKFYIYFHINPLKNEIFYVGKGCGNRAWRKDRRSDLWNKTVKKYGYIINIVEENLTDQEAIEREMFYIKKIGRLKLKKGPLVNLTDGGEGRLGYKMNDEQKKNISDRVKADIKFHQSKIGSGNGRSIKFEYNGKIYGCLKDLWHLEFNSITYSTFYTRRYKNGKIQIKILN